MSTTPTVASAATEHALMQPAWQMARALMGGTRAMRAAGETFLPKFPAEEDKAYKARLAVTTLFAAFRKTVRTMAGLPFAKPVTVEDDVPQRIAELVDDIDQAGNHLSVFARESFADALATGGTHILVDVDAATGETAADDLRRRPRWVRVRAEQLISATRAMVDGKLRYTSVRIREDMVERDGFAEKTVEQVREITPPAWKLWRKNAKGEWAVHQEGGYGLPYVALASFFAGKRVGDFTAELPLENLGHLNVTHWQSTSEQRHALTFSRFCLLMVKGWNAPVDEAGRKGELALGPMTVFDVSGEDGDVKVVETTGAALEAGERDLKKLEELMEAEGVRLLIRRKGAITATETDAEESKDMSELEAMAQDFEDCLAVAAQFSADWIGEPSGGTFTLYKDFGISPNASEIRATVLELRKLGDLAAEDALEELQKAGCLSEGLDIKAAIERAGDDAARTLGLLTRTPAAPPPAA